MNSNIARYNVRITKGLKRESGAGFYLILDNVRSLENIGSIFRTADAIKLSKIFLCGISGTPPNPKIEKASLGAEKTVPFEYYKQTWRLIEKLKKKGFLLWH